MALQVADEAAGLAARDLDGVIAVRRGQGAAVGGEGEGDGGDGRTARCSVCAVRMSVTPVRLGWYEGGMRDACAAEEESSSALPLLICAWAVIWLVWWLDRVRASPVLLR